MNDLKQGNCFVSFIGILGGIVLLAKIDLKAALPKYDYLAGLGFPYQFCGVLVPRLFLTE